MNLPSFTKPGQSPYNSCYSISLSARGLCNRAWEVSVSHSPQENFSTKLLFAWSCNISFIIRSNSTLEQRNHSHWKWYIPIKHQFKICPVKISFPEKNPACSSLTNASRLWLLRLTRIWGFIWEAHGAPKPWSAVQDFTALKFSLLCDSYFTLLNFSNCSYRNTCYKTVGYHQHYPARSFFPQFKVF